MNRDLAGKVFLVTGATEGIGKAAATNFASRGATVVLVARNREKGERLVADLRKSAGNESVSLLVGDMSSIADIRRVASGFRASHNRLDVLVNNAGALFGEYKLSADGIEMSFALNHIGYFGMTTLLLDLLKKTAGARVVSTSSDGHKLGKMRLDSIVKRDGTAGLSAYCDSKLANILFTRELARRLEGAGGIANCFHPGFVRSGFAMTTTGPFAKLVALGAPLFARTPEKGAETLIWLATSPEAGKQTGQYFQDKKVRSTTRAARDDESAAKLWALSESIFA